LDEAEKNHLSNALLRRKRGKSPVLDFLMLLVKSAVEMRLNCWPAGSSGFRQQITIGWRSFLD
jgi:hypothetical protein